MAKCPICNSRKGKRKCKINDNLICSLCCGESRSIENCEGCSFFKDEKSFRNYKSAPYYPLGEIANNTFLQNSAMVIESAICKFDINQKRELNDGIIINVIQRLLDHFHFNEEQVTFSNGIEEDGYNTVTKAIKTGLSSKSKEEVTQLLGTVYRSAMRRDANKRAYVDFIHEFTQSGIY
ncbi:MAG: hypothetical protein KJ737_07805 [Proteobacteria bacterium]|nr:hypothetical protein [Pseudomonadota bacterium]